MRFARCVVFVSALAGCSSRAPTPRPPPAAPESPPSQPNPPATMPPAPPVGTCEARVRRLEAQLAAVPVGDHVVPIAHPARGLGGNASDTRLSTVRVVHGDLDIDGRPATLPTVVADLATLERNWSILHSSPDPHAFAIWADADEPMSALSAVLAATPDFRHDLDFVDAAPHPAPPACPASIDARTCADMRSADPSTRATATSRVITTGVGHCIPLIRFFGDLSRLDSDEKDRRVRAEVPGLIAECHCDHDGVDPDAVEYAVLSALGAGEPVVRSVPISSVSSPEDALTVQEWLTRHLAH